MTQLLVLWVLAQAPELPAQDVPDDAPLARRPALTQVEIEPAKERLELEVDKPIYCVTMKPTARVPSGLFRVQCDKDRRVCLAAPQRLLSTSGETSAPIERSDGCWSDGVAQVEKRIAEGYRFVEAVAEAPPGWYRDAFGRVLQVNFDLHRRVYFGGGWAPSFYPRSPYQLGRGRADFGIEIDVSNGWRQVHRLRFLETTAWLGPDTRIDGALVRYHFSRVAPVAPLHLTTFFGAPRRFDLNLNIVGWFEALRFEWVQNHGFLTIVNAQPAFDLWVSRDLDSYVRIRVGPALELDLVSRSPALKLEGALEGDFTIDRDGFHHLTAQVQAEKLFFDAPQAFRVSNPQRLRLRAGYEVILLAINDYPLTAVIDGRAIWRDDLPAVRAGWDFQAFVGLRFSFWAPARRALELKRYYQLYPEEKY